MLSELCNVFPALSGLDRAAQQMLERAGRVMTIPAGTRMFQEGSACSSYVLVLDGSIRVQKVSENGREIVLYRVEAGQSCVLTTNCLITRDDYSAEGIAESDIKALVMPSSTFRGLLASSDAFRDFVFSAYATRISDLLMLIEEVAFGRIDVRLAAWLGQHGASGEIRATHQEVATELGTAREVVSRQLKEFERRGWVRLYRGRIAILNQDGLSTQAGRGM